jgi:ComF family protein
MGVMNPKRKLQIAKLKPYGVPYGIIGAPLRRLTGQGLDLVFPPQPLWPLSDNGIDSGVHFIDSPQCAVCGFPFPYDLGANVLCGNCTVKQPQFDRARAAFIYDKISRQPILSLKHGGQTHGLIVFAQQLKRAGRELFTDADGLIPVPLHPRRLRKRRFNQAALLARALSKAVDIDFDANCLERVKATSSQGGKTASARRRNMQGAFRVNAAQRENIKNKHLILIDDVLTTGATAEACAGVLKRAGAARVDVLTLARVVKDHAQDGLVIDTIL